MHEVSIRQRQERDYERYRDYSRFQMERDEITAAGEFLQTYNQSEIEYRRDERGLYTVNDDDSRVYLRDVSSAAMAKYQQLADLRPELAWQADRVRIENNHIRFADTMPPDSMYLVVSDCPIKELEALGRDEFGYQRDRQMGFLQLFHADKNGDVTIHGHSFEQNNPQAIQAIYQLFGETRDEERWALSQPIFVSQTADVSPRQLIRRALDAYDVELARQQGGRWYAGRSEGQLREEANTFVAQQTDLLQAHLRKLSQLNPRSVAADQLRYDFILAVRDRFEGRKAVSNAASADGELSAAGASGRAAGESVDFCGTRLEATMSQMGQLGFHLDAKTEWKRGDCVACLKQNTSVGGCSVCRDCENADNRGVDLMKVREKALQARRKAAQLRSRANTVSRHERTPSRRGHHAGSMAVREVRRIVVGGTVTDIYDKTTNQLISTRH